MSSSTLSRRISLLQATAINMIDMVGIGPFVVMPLVMHIIGSHLFLWAWVLGAVIALIDGMIWAELGAALPAAGGSYQFLKAAYGDWNWGRIMPFLFIWQTLLQAPLVVASGAIGFSQYCTYLFHLDPIGKKIISGSIVILITLLLYRKIDSIGRIAVFLWAGVVVTILWIIIGGWTKGSLSYTPFLQHNENNAVLGSVFWIAIGQATVKTIYSYLGYYNVCHLGAEIKHPARNIPRSIFISVIGISILYLSMNISIVRVLSWQEAQHSEFIVSTFMERIYGKAAATIATILVLWIAFASLFAVMLGYSRVPYAAAVDGNFFPFFARLHPEKNFPHASLLFLGGLAFVFSLLFRLSDVISAILAMRILVQFVGQAIGVVFFRKKRGRGNLPFQMWWYPLPVILSILAWLFVFLSTGLRLALSGLLMIGLGVVVFILLSVFSTRWKQAASSTQKSEGRPDA